MSYRETISANFTVLNKQFLLFTSLYIIFYLVIIGIASLLPFDYLLDVSTWQFWAVIFLLSIVGGFIQISKVIFNLKNKIKFVTLPTYYNPPIYITNLIISVIGFVILGAVFVFWIEPETNIQLDLLTILILFVTYFLFSSLSDILRRSPGIELDKN